MEASDRTRAPLLAVVVAALVALAVGLFAGPAMPWAATTPDDSSAEAGFSRDMQVHHQQAVRMSLAALTRAQDHRVKFLALDVATLQQSQMGTMSGWLDDWQLSATSTREQMAWMAGHDSGHALLPDGRMPGMATSADLVALEALKGAAFDRRYLSMLYVHHDGGIPMADAVAELSDRPSVVALATSIRDSQQAEMTVLATLLTELGGTVPATTDHGAGHSN